MAKFKVPVWWHELHGGSIEIEADSIEDANEYAEENLTELIREARSKGETYSDDGETGYDEIEEISSKDQ